MAGIIVTAVAEVRTNGLDRFNARWFYIRTWAENKSGIDQGRFSVTPAEFVNNSERAGELTRET